MSDSLRRNLLLIFLVLGVLGWLAVENIEERPLSLLSLPLPYGATDIYRISPPGGADRIFEPYLSYKIAMDPDAIIAYYNRLLLPAGWYACPGDARCRYTQTIGHLMGAQQNYAYRTAFHDTGIVVIAEAKPGAWENNYQLEPVHVELKAARWKWIEDTYPELFLSIRLMGAGMLLILVVFLWERVEQWLARR